MRTARLYHHYGVGCCPLEKAVYSKYIECFKKFLELGADPKLARNAVQYSGTVEMKQIFSKYDR